MNEFKRSPNYNDKPSFHLAIDATNIRQGGGVTHLSQLLQAANPIQNKISHITVWTCNSTAKLLPTYPWLSIHSNFWTEASLPYRLFYKQFILPKEIAKEGCDVVFSPGGTIPKVSLPTITMSQNMLPFEPNEAARFGRFSAMRLKMYILRHTQSASFKRAHGIIFLTNYAQKSVSQALGGISALQTLVPHGIESRFRLKPRVQRNITECAYLEPFKLLYVSILMPYKHQIEVAKAICQLRAEGLPIEIQFVGATWGSYGEKFKNELKLLDPKRTFLHWSGAEPFSKLHEFYKHADMFVFASSCENLPNIMIEAMAAGLPIVCSDRGPMPEVLGDAGGYFDPNNSESIAVAIRNLALNTKLRQSIAEKAWVISKKYSWDVCANETFKFIATVASEEVNQ
jgi:glycosyltransferase involved in cell wall biosynthesis